MVVVDVIIAKSSVLSSVEIKSGSLAASFYHETASAEPEAQIPFSKRESSRKKMSHLDARDSPQSVATFNWQYRWFRQTLLTGEFVSWGEPLDSGRRYRCEKLNGLSKSGTYLCGYTT